MLFNFYKEVYDEVLCNKSSSIEKNNEVLNGKDLMIERKEQGRKVNKKILKMEEILILEEIIGIR